MLIGAAWILGCVFSSSGMFLAILTVLGVGGVDGIFDTEYTGVGVVGVFGRTLLRGSRCSGTDATLSRLGAGDEKSRLAAFNGLWHRRGDARARFETDGDFGCLRRWLGKSAATS